MPSCSQGGQSSAREDRKNAVPIPLQLQEFRKRGNSAASEEAIPGALFCRKIWKLQSGQIQER